MAAFADFLAATGVFERWGSSCVSEHALRRALERLDEAGRTAWMRPALVRGDSGYGNDGILVELDRRGQPCLLRLRQTTNVQRLVARQFARQDWSRPDRQGCQGCQMVEDGLPLPGWSKKRRVVVVRQRVKDGIARGRRVGRQQRQLDLAGPSVHEGERLRAYAVMVTAAKYPIEAIGPLCRDRADCENGIAELKNPWGLSGFTTQDRLKPRIANIHAAWQHVKAAAEPFKSADRWALLLR